MRKIEFKLGIIKEGIVGKACFVFVFTEKGDVFITPNFKEKLYKQAKTTLHLPRNSTEKNYQSFSRQETHNQDQKLSNRHIQQTIGNFDIGKGLCFRQSFLIHSSVLNRSSMFKETRTQADIKLENGENILDISLLSSSRKFTGVPGKKKGYKKLFDVVIKDSLQFCLVFKGRNILPDEIIELEKIKNREKPDFKGIIHIGGNTKEGHPVITYLDTDYVSAREGSK